MIWSIDRDRFGDVDRNRDGERESEQKQSYIIYAHSDIFQCHQCQEIDR